MIIAFACIVGWLMIGYVHARITKGKLDSRYMSHSMKKEWWLLFFLGPVYPVMMFISIVAWYARNFPKGRA